MARKGTNKNKASAAKLELVFSEKDRRDYLTGFKKRKQERRDVAMKKFDNRFKQEKNRIRLEKRNKRIALGPTVLPDNMLISEEPEAVTHELADHTVSVAQVTDLDLTGGGMFLGKNLLTAEPAEEEDEEKEDGEDGEDRMPGMELKKVLAARPAEKPVSQRSRQNILQAKMKLQEKKNKKKSQTLNKRKARARKKNMKLSNQLKRQKRKGTN